MDQRVLPVVKVKLPREKAPAVREALEGIAPHFEREKSFLETLERLLGF